MDAYTTLFADRACFRQPLSVREVTWWQQTHEVAVTHKIYFSSDPGLGVDDVVVVGGELFEVMQSASPDASVGLGLLWRVHVNQLSGAQL